MIKLTSGWRIYTVKVWGLYMTVHVDLKTTESRFWKYSKPIASGIFHLSLLFSRYKRLKRNCVFERNSEIFDINKISAYFGP